MKTAEEMGERRPKSNDQTTKHRRRTRLRRPETSTAVEGKTA